MKYYKLLIKPNNSNVAKFYENHSTYNEGDSGLDLFVPEDITLACGETKFIDLQIKCEMVNTFLEEKNVNFRGIDKLASDSKQRLDLINNKEVHDFLTSYNPNIIIIAKSENLSSKLFMSSLFIIKKPKKA